MTDTAVRADATRATEAEGAKHEPGIDWYYDKGSLVCSCGWDESKKGTVGWGEHIRASLAAQPAAPEAEPERCCTLEPSHPFHIPGHSTFLHDYRAPR